MFKLALVVNTKFNGRCWVLRGKVKRLNHRGTETRRHGDTEKKLVIC